MAELNQLKDLLNQKNDEIKDLKEKCLQIEQDAQEYVKSALEEIQAQIKIKIEREKADLMNQFARENEAREKIFKCELENLYAKQQKLVQDFEARHILYFIEIERLNLINNDLQEQIANFKEEINKLKSVIYEIQPFIYKSIGFSKHGIIKR